MTTAPFTYVGSAVIVQGSEQFKANVDIASSESNGLEEWWGSYAVDGQDRPESGEAEIHLDKAGSGRVILKTANHGVHGTSGAVLGNGPVPRG